jgi:hypothetical protein
MRSFDDPVLLTPDQRLAEVADILAAGVVRLRARMAIPSEIPPTEISPSSPEIRLEVPRETVLTVHSG